MKYDWMDDAVCREVDPDLWFPEVSGTNISQAARNICEQCMVRNECLDFALENGMVYGIWGGYTERERRMMRKRAKRLAA